MFSNQLTVNQSKLPANRGPIQPATAMQSTGRHYTVEIYGQKSNGKRYKLSVTQWSADADAHQLTRQFSTMGSTTMRVASKGEC